MAESHCPLRSKPAPQRSDILSRTRNDSRDPDAGRRSSAETKDKSVGPPNTLQVTWALLDRDTLGGGGLP